MTDVESLEKPGAFSLALNFVPLLHLASGALLTFVVFDAPAARLGFALGWLYLVPPVLARLALGLAGRPSGTLTTDAPGYAVWWFLTQLQLLFNRVSWLEELLRLVPGLYALWIALWGGRLSPFAFVGPGVVITDRYMVDVRKGAVLGMNSKLAGHLVARDARGRYQIIVGVPRVEGQAILGGEAALGPGATLRAGHVLPAGRYVAPYGEWPKRSDPQRTS
jgi:hypothetical protein